MDSLTQIVLGAAVGNLVAGKKAGNKAMLWGAVGGTIPDLDVLLNFIYEEPRSLLLHRGFSHSVFFAFLIAPLLGYLLNRSDNALSRKEWTMVFFWSIFTHPLLDVFTGYGTGLFVPLWDYRIQFDTIFIIDPVFTLPLLIAFVWLLATRMPFERRIKISRAALLISTSYLLLTVLIKFWVVARVEQEMSQQQIEARQKLIAPAAFTTFLWSVIIEEGDHFLVGYYSLFDEKPMTFREIPANHEWLKPIAGYEETEMLVKFTKGFFVLKKNGANFILNDLRFGTSKGWFDIDADYIFSFILIPDGNKLEVKRKEPEGGIARRDIARLWERTFGN